MLRTFVHRFREPIYRETREALARNWARLPEPYRTPRQLLGRQTNGCSATIGAMPRCDFACTGCYLGESANHVPAEPIDAIKAQMRRVRAQVGRPGNLQLTDGEVTLRPAEEVVELIRYARSLDLMPMLMTHGDSFRRHPGLLERLMREGGLHEVSIHVDTTQRGRRDYKHPVHEADLEPLRDEFAGIIRAARRTTGLPISAATTLTITPDNLDGVEGVTRWLLHNADAFGLVSFQPAAQVGRTAAGLGGGVSVDELWRRIAAGLGVSAEAVEGGRMLVGHPDCNRYLAGIVVTERGGEPVYNPLRRFGHPEDSHGIQAFLDRFGGVSLRTEGWPARIGVWLGMMRMDPGFFLRRALPFVWGMLRRLGGGRPWRFAWGVLRGRIRITHLTIVSHHFMSAAEIATPRGQERISTCVFHVPVGDRLVPMCEVNATRLRDDYYADIRAGRTPGAALPVLYPLRIQGQAVATHA